MSARTAEEDKIGMLLAKAERTDNEHEREVFFAAAQKLATKSEIDLEVLRYQNRKKEQSHLPEKRRIEIGVAGDRGAGTYTDLFLAIAEVNDVETISTNAWVDAYGMPIDIDYTLALYRVIVQQMIHDVIDYLDEEEWRVDGVTKQDARKSFCYSYRTRIKRRLADAKDEALSEAKHRYEKQGVNTDIVLVDKRKQVGQIYWQDARGMRTRERSYGTSRHARNAGDRAAKNARISREQGLGQSRGIHS